MNRRVLLPLSLIIFSGLLVARLTFAVDSPPAKSLTSGEIKMIGSLVVVSTYWEPVAKSTIPTDPAFTKFYDVAACGDRLFAGSNIGLFSLNPKDSTWKPVSSPFSIGKPVFGLAFSDNSCKELFAAVNGAGVWRGNLVDNTWNWVSAGDAEPEDDAVWDVLVANNTVFAAGEFGIRRATLQNTLDWQNTNITSRVVSLTGGNGGGDLLAAVWVDGVYALKPGSTNWVKVAGDPPESQNLVHEAAGNAKVTIAGTQTGLIYAPNNGSWSIVNAIELQSTFATIANGNDLYVGRRNANVYVTRDAVLWRKLPPFPNLRPDGGGGFQVRGFDIGLTDGALYAATTSGVWRLVDSTLR